MNAIQLFLPDNKPTDVWMCQQCKRLRSPAVDNDPKAGAERCCRPYVCSGGCGKELPYNQHRTRCDDCCRKDQEAKEHKAFEKAKKLKPEEWDGPVFDRHDQFFMSLDDYFDHYHEDEELKEGTYVWCAREIKFEPCVDNMIESALDNHHEDASDRISTAEMKRLEDFVDQWAKDQNILSYEPDGKQVVLIEPETSNAEVSQNVDGNGIG